MESVVKRARRVPSWTLVGGAALTLLAVTACSSPAASPQAAATSSVTAVDSSPSSAAAGTPTSDIGATPPASASPSAPASSPSPAGSKSPTKAAATTASTHPTTAPATTRTSSAPSSSLCGPGGCAGFLHPDNVTIWVTPERTGQTDPNPACVNVTVAFGNTMTTTATGWSYWVILEWRDAAGHDRYGSMELGPFSAPAVKPGAVVSAPLHACSPTPAPAGKHATVTSVPRWGN